MKTKIILIGGVSLVALGVGAYLLFRPTNESETQGGGTSTGGGTPPPTGGGGSYTPPPTAKSKFPKGTTVYAKDSAGAKQYGGVKVRKRYDDPNDAYKAFVGEEIGKTTGNVKEVGGMLFTEISVKTDWSFNNPFGGSGNKVWVYDEFLTTSDKGSIFEFAEWLEDEATDFFTDEDEIYSRASTFCKSDLEQLKNIYSERFKKPLEPFLRQNATNLDINRFYNSFKNC